MGASGKRVHGDIRHLEMLEQYVLELFRVHGDIRHLENWLILSYSIGAVHGDIRHLEISRISKAATLESCKLKRVFVAITDSTPATIS